MKKLASAMFLTGTLGLYLAAGSNTLYAQTKLNEKTSVSPAIPTEKRHGLVVNSNKDPVLAQLAIESLKNAGIEDAFLYKITINKDTYYRSVVPFGKETIDVIRGKVAKLPQFDVSKSFTLPLILENPQGIKTLESRISGDFTDAMERNLTRQEYILKVNPYVRQVHQDFWKADLSPTLANEVLGYIYDAAKEFNTPILRTTAIYLHESKGNPEAKGDLDKAPNIAIGPFQTRINTIEYALRNMKAEGIRNVPKTVEEVLNDKKELVRIGVWYFKHNLEKKYGDLSKATKGFNAGHNSKNPNNNKYLTSVLGEHNKLGKRISLRP